MTDETPNSELTEIDEALKIAKANPQQANYFYDTFLNAEIFVPVLGADKKPGEWKRIKATERFFPLYLRHEEDRIIPVFDRLERLKRWSEDKAFDYILLQSHLFIRVIAPEIAIVLNEGTEYPYLFTANILDSLRNAMKPTQSN